MARDASARLELVRRVASCGFGSAADINAPACRPANKIALIQRGPIGNGQMSITFADKIQNARMGGAIGVG